MLAVVCTSVVHARMGREEGGGGGGGGGSASMVPVHDTIDMPRVRHGDTRAWVRVRTGARARVHGCVYVYGFMRSTFAAGQLLPCACVLCMCVRACVRHGMLHAHRKYHET